MRSIAFLCLLGCGVAEEARQNTTLESDESALESISFDLLVKMLQKMPDVRNVRVVKTKIVEFELQQPNNHDNPSAGSFWQYANILHRDFKQPMVFATEGYSAEGSYYQEEPTKMLNANQLRVQYRNFSSSVPEGGPDWEHMLIKQAATDHHRFAERFRAIYTGAWLSTGQSKGGMTATYFKRYFRTT